MARHILIVDDEPAIRYTLSFIFTKHGYQVDQAEDGKEALSRILEADQRKDPFDLLITDVQMPKMTGVELINALAKNQIRLPILVVSGTSDDDFVNKLLDQECSDFLLKPYDLREIVERAERILDAGRKDTGRPYRKSSVENSISMG